MRSLCVDMATIVHELTLVVTRHHRDSDLADGFLRSRSYSVRGPNALNGGLSAADPRDACVVSAGDERLDSEAEHDAIACACRVAFGGELTVVVDGRRWRQRRVASGRRIGSRSRLCGYLIVGEDGVDVHPASEAVRA